MRYTGMSIWVLNFIFPHKYLLLRMVSYTIQNVGIHKLQTMWPGGSMLLYLIQNKCLVCSKLLWINISSIKAVRKLIYWTALISKTPSKQNIFFNLMYYFIFSINKVQKLHRNRRWSEIKLRLQNSVQTNDFKCEKRVWRF